MIPVARYDCLQHCRLMITIQQGLSGLNIHGRGLLLLMSGWINNTCCTGNNNTGTLKIQQGVIGEDKTNNTTFYGSKNAIQHFLNCWPHGKSTIKCIKSALRKKLPASACFYLSLGAGDSESVIRLVWVSFLEVKAFTENLWDEELKILDICEKACMSNNF